MLIRGAKVFQNGAFRDLDLRSEGGRIQVVAHRGEILPHVGEARVDGRGLLLLPGLTDLHSHGAVGEDFSDGREAGLRRILRFEATQGVTQYCPTSLTLPAEALKACFAVAAQVGNHPAEDEAFLAGLHMEGPFLNPVRAGAQNPEWLRAISKEEVMEADCLSGNRLRLLTFAPELPGAQSFLKSLRAAYGSRVLYCLGHSEASYEEARLAFELGASHLSHLFNAMRPLHHHGPGLIPAAMEEPGITADIIADGIHVAPPMLRLAYREFGRRLLFISDSMRACGLEEGDYELGGLKVKVEKQNARLEDGGLAGSVATLWELMQRSLDFGWKLEDAVYAATEGPAERLGITKEAGILLPGRRANMVLASPQLERRAVFLNGRLLA